MWQWCNCCPCYSTWFFAPVLPSPFMFHCKCRHKCGSLVSWSYYDICWLILYPTILQEFCWSTIGAVLCPFKGYSLHPTWVPLTVEEMNFLSLTFMIEIIKKPKLKMYWTDHPVFGTPIFSPKQCHANCVQTPHSTGRDTCNSTVTCFNFIMS
jgi:hypothetical protein